MDFAIGNSIIITGVKSKPSLNGQLGEIKDTKENGRYVIQLSHGSGPYSVNLKPENIRFAIYTDTDLLFLNDLDHQYHKNSHPKSFDIYEWDMLDVYTFLRLITDKDVSDIFCVTIKQCMFLSTHIPFKKVGDKVGKDIFGRYIIELIIHNMVTNKTFEIKPEELEGIDFNIDEIRV